MKRYISATALAGFLLAVPSPGPAQTAEETSLRAFDARVETIGHRLAISNLDLCHERQWRPGIVLHSLAQYPPAAHGQLVASGLDRGPAILALAAGGPAERAGLAPDDILLRVDGVVLPVPQGSGFAATEGLLEAFEKAFADSEAVIEGVRRDQPFTVRVEGEAGCATRFQVVPKRSPDAKADGIYVQLNLGISDQVADDDELAAVIAHEFAHNLLRHKARLAETGRSSARIRQTEIEAERMSVHLLHRAGFDPQAAIRFWARFGRRGLNFLTTPTHPGWRRRIALFEHEIALIREAESAGLRPRPSFTSNILPGDPLEPQPQ